MIESQPLRHMNRRLQKISEQLMTQAEPMLHDEVNVALVDGATKIRNRILTGMLREPKHGRVYKRKRTRHRASAPGEYPASDTGEMARSITFDARDMEIEVGSIITGTPYPVYLEEGTERMDARPWLAPSVEEYDDEIVDAVGAAVVAVVTRAIGIGRTG